MFISTAPGQDFQGRWANMMTRFCRFQNGIAGGVKRPVAVLMCAMLVVFGIIFLLWRWMHKTPANHHAGVYFHNINCSLRGSPLRRLFTFLSHRCCGIGPILDQRPQQNYDVAFQKASVHDDPGIWSWIDMDKNINWNPSGGVDAGAVAVRLLLYSLPAGFRRAVVRTAAEMTGRRFFDGRIFHPCQRRVEMSEV